MDYGVEIIKWQTRGRMAIWLQVKVRGRRLSVQHTGYTPAPSVTQKAPLQLQLRLVALYMCYMPLTHYVYRNDLN